MTEPRIDDVPTVELLRRVPAGDLPAREELFARYRERALAIARARLSVRLRTEVESGDILQEALLEAVRSLDKFVMQDESSLIRWLAVIIARRISAQNRYSGRQKRAADEVSISADDSAQIQLAASDPSPSRFVEARESSELVVDAISDLPERQRELVLLRDYAGSSWESIATELHLPSTDAARMLHARALVKLGSLLRARGLSG